MDEETVTPLVAWGAGIHNQQQALNIETGKKCCDRLSHGSPSHGTSKESVTLLVVWGAGSQHEDRYNGVQLFYDEPNPQQHKDTSDPVEEAHCT
jgi:hypothetical protein